MKMVNEEDTWLRKFLRKFMGSAFAEPSEDDWRIRIMRPSKDRMDIPSEPQDGTDGMKNSGASACQHQNEERNPNAG